MTRDLLSRFLLDKASVWNGSDKKTNKIEKKVCSLYFAPHLTRKQEPQIKDATVETLAPLYHVDLGTALLRMTHFVPRSLCDETIDCMWDQQG